MSVDDLIGWLAAVKVWCATGGLLHVFRGHSRAVTGLLLHPQSPTIVITSSLDGSVRMWSLDTHEPLYRSVDVDVYDGRSVSVSSVKYNRIVF